MQLKYEEKHLLAQGIQKFTYLQGKTLMNDSDYAEQIRDNMLKFISKYALSTTEPAMTLYIRAYQKLTQTVDDSWFLKYRHATRDCASSFNLLLLMAKKEGWHKEIQDRIKDRDTKMERTRIANQLNGRKNPGHK